MFLRPALYSVIVTADKAERMSVEPGMKVWAKKYSPNFQGDDTQVYLLFRVLRGIEWLWIETPRETVGVREQLEILTALKAAEERAP